MSHFSIKIQGTIVNQLGVPVFTQRPGAQLLPVFLEVALEVAALTLATVPGQLCDVQSHVHVMNISDPHIHHSRLHGPDQGLGLLTS